MHKYFLLAALFINFQSIFAQKNLVEYYAKDSIEYDTCKKINNYNAQGFVAYSKSIPIPERLKNINSAVYLEEHSISNDSLICWILNQSDIFKNYTLQDGALMFVREAKNKFGKWQAIDSWELSDCAWSYMGSSNRLKIAPKSCVFFTLKKTTGDRNTKMRIRLKDGETANDYSDDYSNAIAAEIDGCDFVSPVYVFH